MNRYDTGLKRGGKCSTRATFVGVGLLLAASCSWAAPSFTITPAGVSTGYKGFVTLQISGLTNGETVKVAKFLDANNNGVVDGPDAFVQGFKLIDGQAALVAGATNFNTPGDVTVTDGAITAKLNFVGGGFDQQLVGNYAYVVSSPVGRFAPMTNWFAISNAAVVQSFTGTVRCSGTNVPYAVAMLFTPPSGNGGMNPVGGAVANSSGAYTVAAAPGTYMLWAFTSNFVADLNVAPVLTLGPGATITTNLTLVPATQTISGRIVDAGNTNKAIGGLSVFWMSANNEIGSGFTDTNGNFTVGVNPGQWQFGGDDQVFSFLGYLGTDKGLTVDTTTGSVASVTIAVPKATSLIYGSVKDSQNQPIVGLRLEAGPDNGNGPFRGSGMSDPAPAPGAPTQATTIPLSTITFSPSPLTPPTW
jgi:hypothetical protein